MPTIFRIGMIFSSCNALSPPMRTVPSIGSNRRFKIFANVLFPLPFTPATTINSPSPASKLIPRMAFTISVRFPSSSRSKYSNVRSLIFIMLLHIPDSRFYSDGLSLHIFFTIPFFLCVPQFFLKRIEKISQYAIIYMNLLL